VFDRVSAVYSTQHFYLLINALTCFGLKYWPSSGSFLEHVQLMFQLIR